MKDKKNMTSTISYTLGSRLLLSATALSLTFLLLLISAPAARSQGQTAGTGKLFATPEEAAEALTVAAEKYDVQELKSILGPDSYDVISSGDPVADRDTANEFASMARKKTAISRDPRY